MRKIIFVIGLSCSLMGCGDAAAYKAAWIKNCSGAFTPKQCEVLYSMKHENEVNASTNIALTGAAIGISAASLGARK